MHVCVNVMSEVLQADLDPTQLDDLSRLGKIWICVDTDSVCGVEHCLPLVLGLGAKGLTGKKVR